jgi:hypothetical protein
VKALSSNPGTTKEEGRNASEYMEEKTLIHCWWEDKLVQHYEEQDGKSSKN